MKGLVGLLLFPLAFGFLSLSHCLFHSLLHFNEMELSGDPDPMQHIENGLIVTRSGLVVAVTGGVSVVVTALMFLLPFKQQHEDEQNPS